jgi:hypothetical protein
MNPFETLRKVFTPSPGRTIEPGPPAPDIQHIDLSQGFEPRGRTIMPGLEDRAPLPSRNARPQGPGDPEAELKDARVLLDKLMARQKIVQFELQYVEPSKTHPIVMSLNGGKDLALQAERDVDSLLSGKELSDIEPTEDWQREAAALRAAIERLQLRIHHLTVEAGGIIYARDFREKHREVRLRIAKALLKLREAHETEIAFCEQAQRAGAFPNGILFRDQVRLVNPDAFRVLMQGLRFVQRPEQLL